MSWLDTFFFGSTTVAAATSNATVSALALRDSTGSSQFVGITLTSGFLTFGAANTSASGLIRTQNNTTILTALNAAGNNDITVIGTDGFNNIVLGDRLHATNVDVNNPLVFDSRITPSITTAQRTGTGANAGATTSILGQQGQGQTGAVANNAGGPLIAKGGAAGTGGSGAGAVGGICKIGGGAGTTGGTDLAGDTQIDLGTAAANISAKLSLLIGGASALDVYQSAASTLTLDAKANALSVSANGGYTFTTNATASSGILFSATGTNGFVQFNAGTGNMFLEAPALIVGESGGNEALRVTPLHTGTTALTFAAGVTAVQIGQTTTGNATGATTLIQAQGGATNGGPLQISGGTGSNAANAGAVQIQTGGTSKLTVTPSQIAALTQFTLLSNTATYGTTTTFDCSLGNLQQVTLTGNITTLTVSNLKAGAIYYFVFIQDGTGNRTLAVPSTMKTAGGSFTLSTGINKRDTWTGWSDGTNVYEISRGMNV